MSIHNNDTKKRMSIAVDMDETLADTKKKMQVMYFNDFQEYIDENALYGKSTKEAIPEDRHSIVRGYLFSSGFFRDIEPFPNSQEILKELNQKYKVFIVSAATEFPNSLKDKLEWIQEYFPYLNWCQLCLCGDKSLVQTDFMIDDRANNFEYFKGKPYLYTAHHNALENRYERVNNWNEIAEKLL